jgi:large subunit ribosomal protein L9
MTPDVAAISCGERSEPSGRQVFSSIDFRTIQERVMQIILQEDVEKLGHRGDVVTVKSGYARNFLLPNKIGIEATAGNMKALERIRGSLAKKTATELDAAKKQAELLSGVSVKFHRKTGENDQMFGSVTTGDIAEALKAQSFEVDKRQVQLAEPIKSIGEFPVTVKVFRDVTAEIKVHVEKEA